MASFGEEEASYAVHDVLFSCCDGERILRMNFKEIPTYREHSRTIRCTGIIWFIVKYAYIQCSLKWGLYSYKVRSSFGNNCTAAATRHCRSCNILGALTLCIGAENGAELVG